MKKIPGNWWFLIAILISYIVLAIWNTSLFNRSISKSWEIIQSIGLIVIGVFILIYLGHLWLKPKKVGQLLGQSSGIKGWLIAILAGLISMGPIYAWYPLLKSLKKKGMRNALMIAFLNNRAVKLPLLPMMIVYFGWSFTIVVNGYLILFSVINGWLVEKYLDR